MTNQGMMPQDGHQDGSQWTDIRCPEGRTDLANARRILKRFGPDLGHVIEWSQWIAWDGKRWKPDDAAAMRFAMVVADDLWRDAKADRNNFDIVRFATQSARAPSIRNALALAAPEAAVSLESLDSDPYSLNCLNGTIDLRTGELRSHRRGDLITKLCPTRYDPDATAPVWNAFLQSTLVENEVVAFMLRWLGYCLTGVVIEQFLPICYGHGSNGKSVLLKTAQRTLGSDYAGTAPASLLLERKSDSHPTEFASLHGRRLVVAAETSHGAKFNEALIKTLTGGDRISARRMRENFWSFEPTHKLVLSTNYKPTVRGGDHSIWRRLGLVPFRQRFWNPAAGEDGPPELARDNDLENKLAAESEGILASMVRGCLEWQRIGLNVPEAVRIATCDYRNESDVLGRFVTERCVVGESLRIPFSVLYSALEVWCSDSGDAIPSRKVVGKYLIDKGFTDKHSGVRWYLGIGLSEEVEASEK